MRHQVHGAQVVEVRDDRRAERFHRAHGRDAIAAPGVDRAQQSAIARGVAGTVQQLSNSLALGFRLRRLGRASGGRLDAALVRNLAPLPRISMARSHMVCEADPPVRQGTLPRSPPTVPASLRMPAMAAGRSTSRRYASTAARSTVLPPTPPVSRTFAADGVRVGSRQRLVREPRVGNESSGSGRAHHVAAPQGVNS